MKKEAKTEIESSEKKIQNIFAYLSPSVLSVIIPIITLPILTRFLTPKDFGIIALATGFMSIAVSVLALNVNAASERYFFEYRRDHTKLSTLINTTIYFILMIFLISLPAVIFLSDWIAATVIGSSEHSLAIIICYFQGCLNIFFVFYLSIYRNMEEGKKYSFYTIIQMIINTACSLIFVIVFKTGYLGVLYAGLISVAFASSLLYLEFSRRFPYNFSKKMLVDNLKYGIPTLPSYFTGSIYGFLDKYLLSRFVSISSTGIFSIAQNVSSKVFMFMTAVQSTYHPIFMKDMFDKKKDEGVISTGRNFTIFTYISLTAVLGAIVFGEEVIYVLAPPSYYGAINVMLILLCGISVQTFGKIIGAQLAYVKKPYISFPVSIVGLIVNVVLNIILIPKWGAIGAGLSSAFTVFSMNTIFVSMAQRFYPIKYEKMLLLMFYACIFTSAAALIYCRIIDCNLFIKYSIKAMSLLIFVLLGVKANIVTKRNAGIIIRIFKSYFVKPATA